MPLGDDPPTDYITIISIRIFKVVIHCTVAVRSLIATVCVCHIFILMFVWRRRMRMRALIFFSSNSNFSSDWSVGGVIERLQQWSVLCVCEWVRARARAVWLMCRHWNAVNVDLMSCMCRISWFVVIRFQTMTITKPKPPLSATVVRLPLPPMLPPNDHWTDTKEKLLWFY